MAAHLTQASSTVPTGRGAAVGGFDVGAGVQIGRDFAPLGRYAKPIVHPRITLLNDDPRRVLRECRAQRFALLATARKILSRAGKAAGLEFAHDFHRTAKCHHITRGSGVGVLLAKEHGGAFFAGLVTCGNIWACPVCAAKVQERRRIEIGKAIDWAYGEGNLQPVMVTLTFPHRSWHKLGDLLEQQAKALHLLRSGRPWKRFKEDCGYEAVIRSLEVTHGVNGWHPHTHELWFVRKDADAETMKTAIVHQWESACIRAGLLDSNDSAQVEAFRLYAVDVKGNCSASAYLAKQDDSRHWGADREIAKGSTKAGLAKGVHPFGLLAQAGEGNRRAGRLYLSFVIAMKGKAQLYWSPGLKAKAGVTELTDEQVANEPKEDAQLLGVLDSEQWATVRTTEAQPEVLNCAEVGGWPAVLALIDRLKLAETDRLEALLERQNE